MQESRTIDVVAALLVQGNRVLAVQRGYGEQAGGWEFPGGKIEPGEAPQVALCREIREELALDICPGELLGTIEYDYPAFHLSMQCFLCTMEGTPELREHSAQRWLTADELDSVDWLPADWDIIPALRDYLSSH